MGRISLIVLYIFAGLLNFDRTFAEESEILELTSPLGKVKGSFLETRLGKKIYCFRGIRYAEAPVGQKRFQVRFSEIVIHIFTGLLLCSVVNVFFFYKSDIFSNTRPAPFNCYVKF